MAGTDGNRNLVAALSYLFLFITGVIILFVEKNDKFIRFHAMQSTIVFGGLFVFNFVINLIFVPLAVIGVLATLISTLISIVALIIWVVSMIKAFQGQMFKWPIIGDLAEKQVK